MNGLGCHSADRRILAQMRAEGKSRAAAAAVH